MGTPSVLAIYALHSCDALVMSEPQLTRCLSPPCNLTRCSCKLSQVRQEDVLGANKAGDPAAAAAIATASKPVVKFVPKRISLWGERLVLGLYVSARVATPY